MQTPTTAFSRLLTSLSLLTPPQSPPAALSSKDFLSAERCAEFLSRRQDELEQQGRDSLFSDMQTIFDRSALLADWRIAQLDFLVFRAGQERIGRTAGAIWAPVADLPKVVELMGQTSTVPLGKDTSTLFSSKPFHVSESRELKGFKLGSIAIEGFLLFVSLREDFTT